MRFILFYTVGERAVQAGDFSVVWGLWSFPRPGPRDRFPCRLSGPAGLGRADSWTTPGTTSPGAMSDCLTSPILSVAVTVPLLAEADRLFNTVNQDESLNFRLVVTLPSC